VIPLLGKALTNNERFRLSLGSFCRTCSAPDSRFHSPSLFLRDPVGFDYPPIPQAKFVVRDPLDTKILLCNVNQETSAEVGPRNSLTATVCCPWLSFPGYPLYISAEPPRGLPEESSFPGAQGEVSLCRLARALRGHEPSHPERRLCGVVSPIDPVLNGPVVCGGSNP